MSRRIFFVITLNLNIPKNLQEFKITSNINRNKINILVNSKLKLSIWIKFENFNNKCNRKLQLECNSFDKTNSIEKVFEA